MAASKLKIISILLLLSVLQVVYAQDSTTEVKAKANSGNRPKFWTRHQSLTSYHYVIINGVRYPSSNPLEYYNNSISSDDLNCD